MYQFSRAIYRELAPHILDERPSSQQESNHEVVLRRCERAMERLFTDPRHFARPARSLFNDIRTYFSISEQLHAYFVVRRNVQMALDVLAKLPEEGLELNGTRQCQAMTRKGNPCQRTPVPRSEYCPSHQHLREALDELNEFEEVELAA